MGNCTAAVIHQLLLHVLRVVHVGGISNYICPQLSFLVNAWDMFTVLRTKFVLPKHVNLMY